MSRYDEEVARTLDTIRAGQTEKPKTKKILTLLGSIWEALLKLF